MTTIKALYYVLLAMFFIGIAPNLVRDGAWGTLITGAVMLVIFPVILYNMISNQKRGGNNEQYFIIAWVNYTVLFYQ